MGEQLVVTGVELVRFREAEVGAEQIGHGAIVEPLAMQPPLAAGRNEAIRRQHLQHVGPALPLAAAWQAFGPEAVELQFAPQNAGEPAGAPLARPAEPHLAEPQTHDRGVGGGKIATLIGKQRQRTGRAGVLVEHLDRPAPSFSLGRIDLAEV